MHAFRNHIATVLLLVATCAGCSDKDRELAERTGDGSGTFKYKAPTATLPTEGSSANLAKPETTQPKRKGDGSDTFQYKRDARGFPAAPKSGK